ncbi:hypothetical protein [Streptomyces sp. BE230]|uniref:hypothetical protein n=1 Tax=Streptomyces sp. BE230 TaxID=3002526 RepID=UPI002ED48485|nr:hypothetical protein [Streptomyces sp. BE230]
MPSIRILEAVSGLDFSWQPGDVVDLVAEEAEKWADGHRAVWADEVPPLPPVPPMVAGFKPDAADPLLVETYDPAEHSNREVLAYLADVGEEEAVRVLDVEAAGQNRTGIAKEREAVLAQARANDEARAAADQETTELAAEASHGGDLRDGNETR